VNSAGRSIGQVQVKALGSGGRRRRKFLASIRMRDVFQGNKQQPRRQQLVLLACVVGVSVMRKWGKREAKYC